MEVTREILMAYADGELDEFTARQVERAIAEEPALAREIEAQQALRGKLTAHFSAVAEAPLPEAWTAMIADAAMEDTKVVSLADARRERAVLGVPRWGAGMAIAASLVLGVMIGTRISGGGSVVERNGVLLASAKLERALDEQLAADQQGREVQILVSFRRAGGEYCRAFSGTDHSGIACRGNSGWRLERVQPGLGVDASQYRQADSARAELMAAAQDMANGDALDAAQEKAARSRDWR